MFVLFTAKALAARPAAYAAGQAVVVAHVAAHELGAAAYAIRTSPKLVVNYSVSVMKASVSLTAVVDEFDGLSEDHVAYLNLQTGELEAVQYSNARIRPLRRRFLHDVG